MPSCPSRPPAKATHRAPKIPSRPCAAFARSGLRRCHNDPLSRMGTRSGSGLDLRNVGTHHLPLPDASSGALTLLVPRDVSFSGHSLSPPVPTRSRVRRRHRLRRPGQCRREPDCRCPARLPAGLGLARGQYDGRAHPVPVRKVEAGDRPELARTAWRPAARGPRLAVLGRRNWSQAPRIWRRSSAAPWLSTSSSAFPCRWAG